MPQPLINRDENASATAERRGESTRAGNTPRSRKGAMTRARLVEAARAVFEDSGFFEARIADIADRAGLSHGSFYHYFDSKEEVFREVAESQEALLTAPRDEATNPVSVSQGPPSEFQRIQASNRLYLERYRDNARIMGVIEEVSRYDHLVNEARVRRQKHFAERAERGIRRMQAAGEARADLDPALAAVALGSMVARFAELWFVEEWSRFDFDHAVEQLTLLWAYSIGLAVPADQTA